MQQASTPVSANTTGFYLDLETPNSVGYLGGASMVGAGTAIIRDGSAIGQVIGVLEAAAGKADHWTPAIKAKYSRRVHVTITGTPEVVLYPV